jgi:hypothetical protein
MRYGFVIALLMSNMTTICSASGAQDTVSKAVQRMVNDLNFHGAASGGELIIHYFDNGTSIPVLSTEIKCGSESDALDTYGRRLYMNPEFPKLDFSKKGFFVTAGTETGLGIPPPPMFLTVFQNPQSLEYTFCWRIPQNSYDEQLWDYNGRFLPISNGLFVVRTEMVEDVVCSRPESYSPFFDYPLSNVDVRVVGFKGGVPSNYGAARAEGNVMRELFDVPFSCGLAPNWNHLDGKGWRSVPGVAQGTHNEESRGDNLLAGKTLAIGEPVAPKYYQALGTAPGCLRSGVYRCFIGLNPGHLYRLSFRASTLAMDEEEGPWSFTISAAAFSGEVTYNEDFEWLVDGSFAPQADKVGDRVELIHYENGKTTSGKWVQTTTGSDESTIPSDLLVPTGSDSIVMWARFKADRPTPGVGFDLVSIEDLGLSTQ